jgi:hypothetical protein
MGETRVEEFGEIEQKEAKGIKGWALERSWVMGETRVEESGKI